MESSLKLCSHVTGKLIPPFIRSVIMKYKLFSENVVIIIWREYLLQSLDYMKDCFDNFMVVEK